MNASEKKVVVAYRAFLIAGTCYGLAMQDIVKQGMSAAVHTALAEVHAEKYGVLASWGTKQGYVFKDADGVGHKTAQRAWNRNVTTFFKPKKVKTSKQVDVRAKRADSIIRDEQSKRDVDKLVADIYAAWARKQAKKAAK
jgi:hypothetical protein